MRMSDEWEGFGISSPRFGELLGVGERAGNRGAADADGASGRRFKGFRRRTLGSETGATFAERDLKSSSRGRGGKMYNYGE